MRKLVWGLLVAGLLVPMVGAQSLADLARKNKKKDTTKQSRSFTDRDLDKLRGSEYSGMAPMPPKVRRQIERLRSDDPATRANAIIALKWMGPTAAPALPYLVRLGRDSALVQEIHSRVRYKVSDLIIDALAAIGTTAEMALVDMFRQAGQPKDRQVRIVSLLGDLGDEQALDFLQTLSTNPQWRAKAQAAMEKISRRLQLSDQQAG